MNGETCEGYKHREVDIQDDAESRQFSPQIINAQCVYTQYTECVYIQYTECVCVYRQYTECVGA